MTPVTDVFDTCQKARNLGAYADNCLSFGGSLLYLQYNGAQIPILVIKAPLYYAAFTLGAKVRLDSGATEVKLRAANAGASIVGIGLGVFLNCNKEPPSPIPIIKALH